MVNQDLVNYLKQGIQGGHSLEVLKNKLIEEGWSSRKIDEASNFISVDEDKMQDSSVQQNPVNKESTYKQNNSKSRPVGVAIAAILHWGIALNIVITSLIQLIGQSSGVGGILPGFLTGILGGAVMIFALAIALLPLFVGIGIWKGKNGWRVTAIVFGFLAIFSGILNIFNGNIKLMVIIMFLVGIYVTFYLLIAKDAKEYFKK